MKDLLVIVDTSVFVDFFRGKTIKKFEDLIEENRVVLSPYVRLELLIGVRKSEARKLSLALSGLIQSVPDTKTFATADSLLRQMRSAGESIGVLDLIIAAEAKLANYAVLSHDKVFRRMANLNLIKTA